MRADFQQIGAAVAHADDVVVEEDSVVYWRACEHVEAELGRSLIVGSSLPSLQPVVLRHAGLVFIGIGQLIIRAEPFRPGIDRVNLAYVIHEIAALRDNCIACFTEGAVVVMNCDLHEVSVHNTDLAVAWRLRKDRVEVTTLEGEEVIVHLGG